MGADIYLETAFIKLNDELQTQFQQALKRRDAAKTLNQRIAAQGEVARIFDEMHPPTAYFRDPYNSHCLLAQLGLSWWNDVAPRLTEDGHLTLGDVRWLLEKVRSRRLQCQRMATYEQQVTSEVVSKVAEGHAPTLIKEGFTADDVRWLIGRKRALIAFLQTCLELSEAPVCSL